MSFDTIWVKVRADITDFNRKMQGMKASMQKVGNTMKSVGMGMTIGLTAPIALFGAATLKAAANFETGMNRVQALSGATGKEFKLLEKQAKKLGATTQFSASQSADAMGFLAMAGFEANEIFEAMPDTLNLAAAAQIDMGSAADIVTNVLTGLQVPIEELPRAVDVMTKAFTSSNTDLLQLGQAMKFVGPVTAAFGGTIEGVVASLGLLGNAGIQAGMAGRGYRQALIQLVKKQKELGISVMDSTGTMKPMATILRELKSVGFEAEDAMTTFSAQAGTVMSTLLTQGADKLEKFNDTLADSGGIAERVAKVQMQGLNGAILQVKSAFEAFQLAIADSGLLNWVTSFAQGTAEFFRNAAQANPELLRMATAFAAVLAVIGPIALIIGVLITSVGALLGPITLVVGALGLLAAAAVAGSIAGKTYSGMLDQEKESLNRLVRAATSANATEQNRKDLIEEIQSEYPDFLGNLDAETVSNEDLQKKLALVNTEYEKKIILALKEEELTALMREKAQLMKEELNLIETIATAEANKGKITGEFAETSNKIITGYNDILDTNRKKQKDLQEEIQTTSDLYDKLGGKVGGVDTGSGLGTGGGDDDDDSGGGSVTTLTTVNALLLAEAETLLRIAQINDQKQRSESDYLAQIQLTNSAHRVEMDLMNQKIALAEEDLAKDPNNEKKIAAVVKLNAQKIQMETDHRAAMIGMAQSHQAKQGTLLNKEVQEYKDMLQKKADAKAEQDAKDAEDDLIIHEKKMAMIQAGLQAASSFINMFANMNRAAMNKELAAAGDDEKKKDAIRKKYAKKMKAMRIAQAIVNGAMAVTQIMATTPPYAWPFLIPAAAATTAGQIAMMASQSFAKGGIISGPTLAMVGDNPNAKHDPEVVSPLSKLKSIMGNTGGGSQELFATIQGEDIFLANEEYMRRTGNSN